MCRVAKMKDSGVKWIGEIPEDWSVDKVKYHFENYKIIPGIESDKFDRLALTLKGVIKRDKEDGTGLQPKDFYTYQLLRKNDLVFKLIDLQNVSTSRVGLAHNTGIVSPAYIILHPNDVCSNYAEKYFLMMWYREIFNALGDDGVRSSLNVSDLLNVAFSVPPEGEQEQIASYLDNKCSEIDSLYAEIEEQIKLLEEYKKSVITEVVTKGLNPDVEMKDSGIEWIGEIPKEWEVKKGKFCLDFVQKPVREDDEVITCFRNGEVTLRKNRREEGFTVSFKEIGYQGIDIGDLVVHGMDGFAGAIGISDSRGKASPVLNVLDSKNNKRYIMFYLRNMAYNGVFIALSTGIRVRTCDTNWGKLRELFYIIPSIEEQNKIVNFLDDIITKTEALIADKQHQLSILEQYKKSLIYEYVTGKKEVPA